MPHSLQSKVVSTHPAPPITAVIEPRSELRYFFFASPFFGVGFARQYALRFTLPLASLLSATQLQSFRAVHAASSFNVLHAGGFFAGAFFSCADAP